MLTDRMGRPSPFWLNADGNMACFGRVPTGSIIRAAASVARIETGREGRRLPGGLIQLCAVSARQRFKDSIAFNYMARYMLSDLSFDDYLEAGGWRGYAQKAAKDAVVTEARSWLEPLQEMLEVEQARLLALQNTTADDFVLVVAIRRELGKLKRYLKISTANLEAPRHRTKLRLRRKTKTKRISRTRRRIQ